MRKGFFTARSHRSRKEPQKPRSGSNPSSRRDEISQSWVSTDPKDLPEGITVGSMTVPYPPPYYLKEEEKEENTWTFPRKKKSRKEKKQTDSTKHLQVKDSPSSKKRPFSFHRRAASDTPPDALVLVRKHSDQTDAKQYVKDQSGGPTKVKVKGSEETDGGSLNRKDVMTKVHLQRSCSVDALDDIGEDKGVEEDSPTVPKVQLRRTSTETDRNSMLHVKPQYNRYTSYHGQTPLSRAQAQRSKLYKRPAVSTDSPILSHGYKREMSYQTMQRQLFRPKSVDNLFEILQSGGMDVNAIDVESGDAPIHSIAKKKRKDRLDLLLALLVNSNVDVNLVNSKGNAAIHIAVEEGDMMCIKALVVFGADINLQGSNQFTPFDLCIDNGHLPDLESLFMELGAKSSVQLIKPRKFSVKVPRMHSVADNLRPPRRGERLCTNDRLSEFINRRGMKKMYQELEVNVNRRLSLSASIGSAEDAFALVLQQRELALFNKTMRKSKVNSTSFSVEGGSRILFLDGGGIKGLVQLEILMQIEEETGRPITELFDWIVGSSTGGVIALSLVYSKRSLQSLRQLYFKLKERIFSKARYGFGYNSEALDDILQEYLDPDIKLTDVSHPKVLIAAVNKATTNLELHFFNNCFGNDYCDFHVWKVARYTCAAPMFFTEVDNYVDGGVICNNPTDYGLTEIQNFFRLQGLKLPIAVVVSVGSGRYPASKMGKVDAQEALFFGKQWLRPTKLIKKTQNLLALLSNAVVESEMVAVNSESRCREQNIPFYRFSPDLEEIIAAGETDNDKLFTMILQTKVDTKTQRLSELVDLFRIIAEANRTSKSYASESIAEEEAEDEGEEVNKNRASFLEDSEPLTSPPPPVVVVIKEEEDEVEDDLGLQLFEKEANEDVHFTVQSCESAEEEEKLETGTNPPAQSLERNKNTVLKSEEHSDQEEEPVNVVPVASSSPDLQTERHNLNRTDSNQSDLLSIDQSQTALSDIQEESYYHYDESLNPNELESSEVKQIDTVLTSAPISQEDLQSSLQSSDHTNSVEVINQEGISEEESGDNFVSSSIVDSALSSESLPHTHPVSTESTPEDSMEPSKELDESEPTSPEETPDSGNRSADTLLMVDQQIGNGDSEHDHDFLLSYQTFAKQHRVDDHAVTGSKVKETKTTHYKLETRTSKSSVGKKKKRETAV